MMGNGVLGTSLNLIACLIANTHKAEGKKKRFANIFNEIRNETDLNDSIPYPTQSISCNAIHYAVKKVKKKMQTKIYLFKMR